MRARRQHGEHRITARRRVAVRPHQRRAGILRRIERRLHKVEDRHRMSRLDQIGEHRPAHIAGADKADFSHMFVSPIRTSCRR